MTGYEELAKRIEGLTGPDREVFCAAFRAVFPEVSAGAWDAIDAWDAKYDRFCAMLDIGADIDAAMTVYVKVPDRIPSNPRTAMVEALRQRAEVING